MTGQPPTYDELIREVFIDPIRSVVVVDDKFPTLDRLLEIAARAGDSSSASDFDKSRDFDAAQGIVRFCHTRERPWLVEFHDGQPPLEKMEAVIADHLSQSDLMVLDYHLDPNDPESGDDAIEILRRVASNYHFNLVVVYTQGSIEAGGDIERVWQKIVIGLSTADPALTCHPNELVQAQKLIERLEDQDAGILDNVRAAVGDDAYLGVREDCRSKSCGLASLMQEKQYLSPLSATLDRAPDLHSKQKCQLLRWALHQRQEALRENFAQDDLGPIRWAFDKSSKVNWIRTDRLFVTVVSKREAPGELPNLLCKALRRWGPEPHRLLMSMMRTVLAEVGVKAEDEVLANRYLQKAWFDDLMIEREQERRWKIQATVSRQWERLGDALTETVGACADKLSSWLRECPTAPQPDALFEDLDDAQVLKHRNCYVSTKPVTGHHLTTGHILEIDDTTWLCLSPACDLVPGQRDRGWHKRLADHLPFVAVQLYPDDEQQCLGAANRGNHLFLTVDGQVACFSFTPTASSSAETANDDAAPRWEQMFASRQGRCNEDFRVQIRRIRSAESDRGELTIECASARIVAQLRYEYALNLLHRLGATLSRVGLDFEPLPRKLKPPQTQSE